MDWRISKKLLPGSLVLLSTDEFNTNIFVGLLKNCDNKQRNETHKQLGYVAVNIEILKPQEYEQNVNLFLVDNKRCNFQMIESSAYFESYHHVLK
jgi:hypothetical protein